LWWMDFYLPSRFIRHKKSEKVMNNEKAKKTCRRGNQPQKG
jgi:hypothetical protein